MTSFTPRPVEQRNHLYPAITACICEERPPSRAEIRFVAGRLWREALAWRFACLSDPPSFAVRRVLLRTARAALGDSVRRPEAERERSYKGAS